MTFSVMSNYQFAGTAVPYELWTFRQSVKLLFLLPE